MINFIIALKNIHRLSESILYIMRSYYHGFLPAADIRRECQLTGKIKINSPLSEDLSNIRIGDNKSHNKLLKLSNKYKSGNSPFLI
ncbi:hypothetical protein [Escherichia coli]|uniref:hypothetical protein n=1 Tax=Escherichia coli TaxID=562 RepID=UPI0035CEC172